MAITYDRSGSGESLVLIHGIGSRWQVWDAVRPALAQRHDTIAIDLPGFGASPHDGTGPSVEAQAERVERFFDELGLERPHVAGNSMGGGIALELARRGSVASATAVSPVGFWTPRERTYAQTSLVATRTLVKALRPTPLLPALFATGPTRTAMLKQVFNRPANLSPQEALDTVDALLGAEAFDACLAAFDGYVFRDGAQLQGVPVTVAWGDHDFLLLHRQAARARRALPQATHITLHGCGHVPFADDPAQAAAALLAGASGA